MLSLLLVIFLRRSGFCPSGCERCCSSVVQADAGSSAYPRVADWDTISLDRIVCRYASAEKVVRDHATLRSGSAAGDLIDTVDEYYDRALRSARDQCEEQRARVGCREKRIRELEIELNDARRKIRRVDTDSRLADPYGLYSDSRRDAYAFDPCAKVPYVNNPYASRGQSSVRLLIRLRMMVVL